MANLDRNKNFPNQTTDNDPTECVALTVADLAGNIDGTVYDPDFQYAMTLLLEGQQPNTGGLDPLSGMQSAVAYGLLPASEETFTALDKGELYIANWQNYTPGQKRDALKYTQKGIINLWSDDVFNSIRNHMIVTGQGVSLAVTWFQSFMTTTNGVLSAPAGGTSNHNVAVYECVTIDGAEYLRIKPWLGPGYGDGGYGYLSKEMCNTIAQEAFAFNPQAARWFSLVAIAVTKYPRLASFTSLLLALNPMNTPQTPPVPATAPLPPKPTPTPSGSLLATFCGAIKFREGAAPGNNNPGNCKFYYGGYLPVYGNVGRSPGGFAMFPTYAQGFLYLENTVKNIIHHHPGFTFYDFFYLYAPSNDGNDPKSYAEQVATTCGLPVNSLVSKVIS